MTRQCLVIKSLCFFLINTLNCERRIILTVCKRDIVKNLHESFDMRFKGCASIVDSILEIIIANLENGEDVMISGFGRFNIKTKPEREGRNPATNQAMTVVTFKGSRKLRKRINVNP